MTRPEVDLTDDLIDFLQSGVSILVATRDAQLRPQCLRAMGATVDRARGIATLLLPEAVAEKTLAKLRDNGFIAITFSRPVDHRSIQLKGKCSGMRPCTDEERAMQERYRAAFAEQLQVVGLPRAISMQVRCTPSVAVDVTIAELFEQTPGPGAGRRITKAAG
jgi:hypothetical protein